MLVSVSSVLWAPTQELVFGRSLTPRLDAGTRNSALVRKNFDRKYDGAKQVSGETRSDLDWYPQGRKDGSPEKWPMRKSPADS